jgi:alkanesulfonate monooxygenase SsuD/methylene tetrahydromethanopterin reductase-like flavin-dependent oxidoreductase (luciferase family)
VPFGSPLAAIRETIQIVRAVTRRGGLQHDGPGRTLQSPPEPVHVPIYVAALGPRYLELTGELADGWIGNTFVPEQAPVYTDRLAAGAARAGRALAELDLVIPVAAEFTQDPGEAARRHADGYASAIGAMGAPGQNFDSDALSRQGFGDDVLAVQELWRAGRHDEAAARVPAELGYATNLLGTPEMIAARLRLYRDAGITTLQAKVDGSYASRLNTLARLVELTQQVTAEVTGPGH